MTFPTATIYLPYHALDDVHQRGTRAAQPAASAVVAGTLYSVTDEGDALERSDGTTWAAYAPSGGGPAAAHGATHDADGTDPVPFMAQTNLTNTFTVDQTVNADLYVTGDVNPARVAVQRPKIDQLIGPGSGRTLLSNDLAAGMSLRYDVSAATGKVTVGNYDTQTYQPLALEADHIALTTGTFPPGMAEHLRVHPSGGVTVGEGTDHNTDPGMGVVAAEGLSASYLDLAEGVPLDPPLDIARLHALDANGFTQLEMRDAAARVVRLASDNVLIAKVTEPAGVGRGQCVYLDGAMGANPLVRLARANSIATMPTIGLALDAGVVNAFIRVLLTGTLQRLDTTAFSEGTPLFVSPTTAGGFTTTLPNAPDFAQRVGFVTRSHATAGEMLVLTTAISAPPRLHHETHEPGGSDALTALDAGILTSGTLPDARLSAQVARRDQANTYTFSGTGARSVFNHDIEVARGAGTQLMLTDNTQAANGKKFRFVNFSQQLWLNALSDDEQTNLSTPLSCYRNGDVLIGSKLTIGTTAAGVIVERGRGIPLGEWIDYTPTLSSGAGTWTGTVVVRYTLIGKTVILRFTASDTTLSGAATGELYFTLPIAASTAWAGSSESTIRLYLALAGGGFVGGAIAGPTTCMLRRSDLSAFPIGTGIYAYGQVVYEIA